MAWSARARRPPADAAALARAIPVRPLTTADRTGEEARLLERSRATLDWESHVSTMEAALAGLGGRAYALGEDRWGQTYFTLGAYSPHVFVVGPNERVNAAPRRAAGAAAAAAGGGALGTAAAAAAALPSPASSAADLPSTARRRGAAPGGGFGSAIAGRPVQVSQHQHAIAVTEAAARRACTLQPGEWGVYDSPASLAALIRSLHPLGRTEGPLRAALLRREPLLVAAMLAAGATATPGSGDAPSAAATAAAVAPALTDAASSAAPPPSASCAFCAKALPPPPDAAGEATGNALLPTLHCFVCHASFATAAPMAAAARALFLSHVRRCWAAAAHAPVTRAVAVACARAAPLGRPPSDADLLSAAAATGAPAADVAAAFDPPLAQLRRQAVCFAEAVDWARLRQPAVWPPAARAQWAAKVLAAASGGELNRLLHVLIRALQADDSAAYSMSITEATLKQQRDGVSRKRTQAELAAAVEEAAASSELAPAGTAKWRWVPFWFLDRMPSAEAVVGMRTVAAAAWTLRSVAAMLRPNLLAHAAPPLLATEALL